MPKLRQHCTMSTIATTTAIAIITTTTMDYNSPVGDKAHSLLFTPTLAFADGHFPNSNGFLRVESEVFLLRQIRDR